MYSHLSLLGEDEFSFKKLTTILDQNTRYSVKDYGINTRLYSRTISLCEVSSHLGPYDMYDYIKRVVCLQ